MWGDRGPPYRRILYAHAVDGERADGRPTKPDAPVGRLGCRMVARRSSDRLRVVPRRRALDDASERVGETPSDTNARSRRFVSVLVSGRPPAGFRRRRGEQGHRGDQRRRHRASSDSPVHLGAGTVDLVAGRERTRVRRLRARTDQRCASRPDLRRPPERRAASRRVRWPPGLVSGRITDRVRRRIGRERGPDSDRCRRHRSASADARRVRHRSGLVAGRPRARVHEAGPDLLASRVPDSGRRKRAPWSRNGGPGPRVVAGRTVDRVRRRRRTLGHRAAGRHGSHQARSHGHRAPLAPSCPESLTPRVRSPRTCARPTRAGTAAAAKASALEAPRATSGREERPTAP